MNALKSMHYRSWKCKTIDATFPVEEGEAGLSAALARIASEAEEACESGFQFVVLSDKNVGPTRAPVSPLLATGKVHHHLIDTKKRCRIGKRTAQEDFLRTVNNWSNLGMCTVSLICFMCT